MRRFRVSVSNPSKTEYAGPVELSANNEEDAKAIFAAHEGSSVVRLTNAGLTEWDVLELAS